MGTSLTGSHLARAMISRPILKPMGLMRLFARMTACFFTAKKPLMGSVDHATGHANKVAPQLRIRLKRDHLKPTPPPRQFLEPVTNSASPFKIGSAIAGRDSGSCCRSASMHITMRCSAIWKPRSTALLKPLPSSFARQWIFTFFPSSMSSLTIFTVAALPGLSSSTINTSVSISASFIATKMRSHNGLTLSTSLYVGTMIETARGISFFGGSGAFLERTLVIAF
mmetsp:Transcript_47729/g.88714  ORF Transcript_47729/g.88714 Transcript_47729/m.88714 type:complete len:225 (+) Transcript_47729:333-1007(+)